MRNKIAAAGAIAAFLAAFVGGWEGLRTEAYRDIVGVPTICYGETKGVRLGDKKTKAECNAMLLERLAEFEDGLDRCLVVPVPDKTKVAFVSWAYNVGLGAACRSTLVRKANAGDLVGACNELPRWNRAGGKVVKGLTNRRKAEQRLCLEGLQE